MSVKYKNSTADVLNWTDALYLINRLERDGNYTIALFVAVSIFFGTRVSDTLSLKWCDLLNEDLSIKGEVELTEKKTKKFRKITINQDLGKLIKSCYANIKPITLDKHLFISQKKSVFTIQRMNTILKKKKVEYNINIKNFSCHSLRKCFGSELYRRGEKSEYMLVKLSMIFNHSSTAITRRYIGISDVEIANSYDLLSF